jgi:hypothetical protein
MEIKAEWSMDRETLLRDVVGDPAAVAIEAVLSTDTGSVNYCTTRRLRFRRSDGTVAYATDRVIVVSLRGADDADRPEIFAESLMDLEKQRPWTFQVPSVEWNLNEVYVCPEDAVDHKPAVRGPNNFGTAINYGLFNQLCMMVKQLQERGRQGLIWLPVNSRCKSGLETFHDEERKRQTHFVAPVLLERCNETSLNRWLATLKRPKPQQDVCDATLQAQYKLESFSGAEAEAEAKRQRAMLREVAAAAKAQKAREVAERKAARAAAAEAKRVAKAQREAARLAAGKPSRKRKRPEGGEGGEEPEAKRARVVDLVEDEAS